MNSYISNILFNELLKENTKRFQLTKIQFHFSTKSSNIWRSRYFCKVIKYSSAQVRRLAIAGCSYLYGMETQYTKNSNRYNSWSAKFRVIARVLISICKMLNKIKL